MILRLAALTLSLVLASAGPVAAAGALCHTAVVSRDCACCPDPGPASACRMGCADASEAGAAGSPLVIPPRSEHTAAVIDFTHVSVPIADAAASRPIHSARAPDTFPEALYLLDRTLRL